MYLNSALGIGGGELLHDSYVEHAAISYQSIANRTVIPANWGNSGVDPDFVFLYERAIRSIATTIEPQYLCLNN